MSALSAGRLTAVCQRCFKPNTIVCIGASPSQVLRCSHCNHVLGSLGMLMAENGTSPAPDQMPDAGSGEAEPFR